VIHFDLSELRFKQKPPWINFYGAFAVLRNLSVGGFRFMGMRGSPELVRSIADNLLLVREN